MKTLYHGSYINVPNPLVSIGRKELDFGPGFYVTGICEQAERWAKRVCVIRAMNTPLLSEYEFYDEMLPKDIRCLRLEEYDRQWLDFIVSSRRGEEPWKDYDIIEGGVANDQVIDTVEDYFAGRMTAEQALGQLNFARPTHQMCINNQNIIDKYLKYVGSRPVTLNEEGGKE